jgi:selenophosphate synthetase-related protein
MPIVKKVGTYRGIAATGFRNAEVVDNVSGVPVYIALHDADAHDVQAAGSLVGLDCSDKFEVQSGYYDAAIVWQLNDPLMVGSDGVFTLATVGKFIVGYITAVGNGTNNTIITGGKTPSATDMKVIQFKTAQNGQVKA